jgi:cytochrome c oxidase subunit 4
MSDQSHAASPSYGKYFIIWVWLIVLLAAATFVSYLPITKLQAIGLIMLLSLVKAILVTLFYMHLKFEKMPIWLVAIFPFFLLGVVGTMLVLGVTFIRL